MICNDKEELQFTTPLGLKKLVAEAKLENLINCPQAQ